MPIPTLSQTPTVLVAGKVVWVLQDLRDRLVGLANVVLLDSESREDFIEDLPMKYPNLVAIYRCNDSSTRIGHMDKEFISILPPTVRAICHNGAGYDQVDTHAAQLRGIEVSHTPGALDESTATVACWLILGAMRNFALAQNHISHNKWKHTLPLAPLDPERKTLAIIGLGGIGKTVARRMALGWNMKIIYYNRRKLSEEDEDLGSGHRALWKESLEGALREADVVSLHLPLNASTKESFSHREFGWMKTGAVFINTARGGIVDEPALIEALHSGQLYSAGLDVFPSEPEVNPALLAMPNILLLPHMGSASAESGRKMEEMVVNNVVSAVNGLGVVNLVAEQRKFFRPTLD